MPNYEITVSRKMSYWERATVTIMAEDEDTAIEQAFDTATNWEPAGGLDCDDVDVEDIVELD